jgi:hypothetical protein
MLVEQNPGISPGLFFYGLILLYTYWYAGVEYCYVCVASFLKMGTSVYLPLVNTIGGSAVSSSRIFGDQVGFHSLTPRLDPLM